MEISKKYLDTLDFFFNEKKKNNNFEIEVRFNSKKLDHNKLQYIFNKLTFDEQNGGLNLKNYKLETQLDIIIGSDNNKSKIRLRILDEDVKKYWLYDDLNNISIEGVNKTKIENIDIREYLIRFSLSNEEKIKDLDINKYNNRAINKYFRLKNRYSIYTDDNMFRIDISTVKSLNGFSFKDSNIFDAPNEYELEIEFVGETKNKMDLSEDLSEDLIKYTWLILSLINDSLNILSESEKTEIIRGYDNLINVKAYYKKNGGNYFTAANPVTLHRLNMVASQEKQNILNKYAITLKADGERYLLYVHKSSNFKLNGNFYLINKNFDILEMGYKDINFNSTLIEGEYIKENNTYFAYDILFYKGSDVRLNPLNITIVKKVNKNSRIDYLNIFNKDHKKNYNENYNNDNIIKFELKKYLYSKSSDGSDIFSLFATLWSTRKNNNFNVDGVIFTPIREDYPLHGKSWFSLFKWKPPNLNTIDFLIKIKKNENGDDIILPYYLKDADNKVNKIRHYKTLELFVGKNIEVSKQNKIQKKIVCTPFNPLNVDNDEIHKYNITKIFLDESDKLIAIDPITNNIDEIFNESIIEFNYDVDGEDFFKWKPIRVRYDKTRDYKLNGGNCGNFEHVANDIYNSIMYPITDENLSSGHVSIIEDKIIDTTDNTDDRYFINKTNIKSERLSYQNFHNLYIKDKQLELVAPSLMLGGKEIVGKILDLGVGKGYEINRWKKFKFAEAVGIDRDYEAIEIAKQNYKTVPRPKPKSFFIRGDVSKLIFPSQACAYSEANKIRLKQYIPIKYYFDVVSIQFALHYFFEDETTLRSILQNVSDNLKQGGYFIGTCFSGERIFDALKNKKEIKGIRGENDVIWSITKLYKGTKFETNKPNLGKAIEVYIKSIGIKHIEYLVNFTYLDEIMIEYGFEKILVNSFKNEYDNMKKTSNKSIKDITISDEEKEFSFYNNLFIYKKIENAPDNLYPKLLKLIDKTETLKYKNKLKVDNKNVNIINVETEKLIENFESKN